MPNPSTATAGKKVVQYAPSVPGRANSARPTAARSGPTVSGNRLPILATSPPDVRLDPAVLLATLDHVQGQRRPVDVQVVALADTYTIGPVVLTFR